MAKITEVPPPGQRKSSLRELIETVVLALVIALAIRTFVVEVYRVRGSSMEATLTTGERVLVNKFIYRFAKPLPGDIIVFAYPRQPDQDFIKRVVAVAGDRVEMRAGKIYVNGQFVPEVATVLPTQQDDREKIVPEESIWVYGDNRNNSEDSRVFGEVPLANVRGKAFFRIWPPFKASSLERP